MRSALSIAVVQPGCVARDVTANAFEHARSVRAARARVVVFPELSLTGYELDADVVSPVDDALAPLVDACEASGSVALVGAPVADGNRREYIAMLRVGDDTVDVAYRKMWLGGDEPARFTPGPGPVALDLDGWRLGLAICKDAGAPEHTDITAALGIDAYVAGMVHLPGELAEQDARGLRIARQSGAYVAFASCAASTGGPFVRTAGHSAIWSSTGDSIARSGFATGEIARATLG